MIDFLNRVLDWLLKNDVSASEMAMNTVIIAAGMAVIVSMYNLHKANSKYEKFNVVTLITNKEGILDGAKCMEMTVLLLMSWGFVAQITAGKLSDAYTAAYVGAFAMRGAYGAFLRKQGDPAPPEGTTKVTESTTKTTDVTKTTTLKDPI